MLCMRPPYSEGNVQISTAILADVSSEDNRASALAVVGIAFSLCFTIGVASSHFGCTTVM